MRLTQGGKVLFRYPDTMCPVLYIGRHESSVGDPAGMFPHSHPRGVEICYIERGNIEWWTDDEIRELHPHDVFVTLPRAPHGAVDSTLSPCEYLWVHLAPDLLPEALRDSLSAPGFAGLHGAQPEAGEILGAIFREHLLRDRFAMDACESLAAMLVVALARSAGRVSAAKGSELVSRAKKALIDAPQESHSVAAVADRLCISDAWLTKKFRQEVGQTPAAWLIASKITDAKQLLRTTDEPIGGIALKLGFSSSQYFATAFRRITGRTPSEYRNLHPGSSS